MQIIGDHHGAISHLWERECTIQRRNQKLIEVAPSPSLNDGLRARIIQAAKELAAAANYDNLGTFEFLVDGDVKGDGSAFAFIEANPRLQVEHTVTEEVLGVDLVQAQLAVADGATLGSLGLAQAYIPRPRGYAMQLRVNMEVMDEHGATKPTGGTLGLFDLPAGPGVRVDTFGRSGYKTSAAFDSLLAKVIVHSAGANWTDVVQKATRTLREFRIGGVATNIPFLGGDPGASGFHRQPHQYRFHRCACRGPRPCGERSCSAGTGGSGRCRDRCPRPGKSRPVRPARSPCRRRCRARSSRSRSGKATSSAPASRSRCSNP